MILTMHERRSFPSRVMRPIARLVSAFVEPVFYWMGWLDPSGHPSNSKMIYTAACGVALAMILKMGSAMTSVSLEFVFLVAVVLLFCSSMEAFKKFMQVRFRTPAPKGEAEPDPAAPATTIQVTGPVS